MGSKKLKPEYEAVIYQTSQGYWRVELYRLPRYSGQSRIDYEMFEFKFTAVWGAKRMIRQQREKDRFRPGKFMIRG